MASNDRLLLGTVTDPVAAWYFTNPPQRSFVESAAIAPCYGDFDPSTGGAIHYETDHASWARVTWLDVPEYLGVVANRFQVTLHVPSGHVDVVYGPMTSGLQPMRFGFTPGGDGFGAAIDASAALPWSSGLGIAPPRLQAAARPQLGTTLQLRTDDLAPGTATVLTALGFVDVPGGQALGAFGLPDCTLYVGTFDWLFVLGVGSGSANASLPLPASPLASGLPLFAQSAALSPGYNPAGLLVSNGLCLQLR